MNTLLRDLINTKLSHLCFFVLPIIAYALFATNFTFNFFEPYFLWKGYNYYFLALINGQLDVPAHAIGREASYIGDKVYMYYGALPLLIRALLYPFVNLEQSSIAALSVFIFSVIGQSFLQYVLLSKFKNYVSDKTPTYILFGFVLLCAVLWFGSATFVIVQNSTLYHEPYAAALCLVNILLGLLIKDNFLLGNSHKVRIVPYAILAALCIHARMPTALALYCLVVYFIVLQSYKYYQLEKPSAGFKCVDFFAYGFKTYYLSLFVLFIGGVSILVLNYLKFDNVLAFMGKNYGYFFFETFSERVCNIVPKSDFASVLRVIPNTVIYLTGSADIHWSLTWHLNTGFGRKEVPLIPLIVLWLLPLLAFLSLIVFAIKRISSPTFKHVLVLVGLLSIGAIFQLSYPTIAHRYIAELWLPLAFALVFLWSYFLRCKQVNIHKISYVITGVFLAAAVSLVYQFSLSLSDKYYLQDGPIYDHEDYHYPEKDIQLLSSLTKEKIKALKLEAKANKKQACDELAQESGLKDILEKRK